MRRANKNSKLSGSSYYSKSIKIMEYPLGSISFKISYKPHKRFMTKLAVANPTMVNALFIDKGRLAELLGVDVKYALRSHPCESA